MELANYNIVKKDQPVVCWFSGGITSAVACKLAMDLFGKENCIVLFIDTRNEDDDTYRFMKDCEEWYGKSIQSISSDKHKSIQHVWRRYKGMNFAHGAICSSELKREVRIKWQKENEYSFQVFGFDIDETKRAKSFTMNYSNTNPLYPLLLMGYSKKMCIDIVRDVGIEIPTAYKLGLNNNNCLQTGCVQGGIGYWQLIQRILPDRFERMAAEEHYLTELKGSPVTMLKNQSKAAKDSGNQLVFLKPHPSYPHIKDISMMKGREPKPLTDCNGFCGVDDLERNPTEKEINYQQASLDF
ncbi:phosphoadenosine phosphosulfate reductase family protein [Candidatus Pacearchaeota archaeon]|nr:phosphoadenosine phosphosulfate reductase family protein [Candidatus Pacearchaeota archaeon]